MSTALIDHDVVRDAPLTRKLVYLVIRHQEPISQMDIVEELDIPRCTVRSSLEDLINMDAVDATRDLSDSRQVHYRLTDAGDDTSHAA